MMSRTKLAVSAISAVLMLCLGVVSAARAAGNFTLIYQPLVQGSSLVLGVTDIGSKANGDTIFTLDDGAQLALDETDIIELLRTESANPEGAAFSFIFPSEGLKTVIGETGKDLSIQYFPDIEDGDTCLYGLDLLPDYGDANTGGQDCSSSGGVGRGVAWADVETLDETVDTALGQYPLQFKYSLGEPDSSYKSGLQKNWMFYIQHMNTEADLSPAAKFYLRAKLFDGVYVDIKQILPGSSAFISLPPELITGSGQTKEALLKSMTFEIVVYDTDGMPWPPDTAIARISDLAPVTAVFPASRDIDPTPFSIRFVLSDPGTGGVGNLDLSTLSLSYNGKDITQLLLEGVAGGTYPLDYYAEDPGESGKYLKYIVRMDDVSFNSGIHEIELGISDSDGHLTSQKAVYTVPPSQALFFMAETAEYNQDNHGISFVAIRGDDVVYEDYPNGGSLDGYLDIGSGTKSIAALIAALMATQGLLDFDETIAATIQEWQADPVKSTITIRQLLSMTSGLETGGEYANTPGYLEALDAPLIDEPGTYFRYGGTPFQIFGEVMRRKLEAVNDTILNYVQTQLFMPAGVEIEEWETGPDGNPNMSHGINITARDWALLGKLILKKGTLNNTVIIQKDLLEQCFQGSGPNPAFGMGWWLNAALSDDLIQEIPQIKQNADFYTCHYLFPGDYIMAGGYGKQRLYIVPSLDLVLARQGNAALTKFTDAEFFHRLLHGIPCNCKN